MTKHVTLLTSQALSVIFYDQSELINGSFCGMPKKYTVGSFTWSRVVVA